MCNGPSGGMGGGAGSYGGYQRRMGSQNYAKPLQVSQVPQTYQNSRPYGTPTLMGNDGQSRDRVTGQVVPYQPNADIMGPAGGMVDRVTGQPISAGAYPGNPGYVPPATPTSQGNAPQNWWSMPGMGLGDPQKQDQQPMQQAQQEQSYGTPSWMMGPQTRGPQRTDIQPMQPPMGANPPVQQAPQTDQQAFDTQNKSLLRPQTVMDPAYYASAAPKPPPPQPTGPMQPGQAGYNFGPPLIGGNMYDSGSFGWTPSFRPGENEYMTQVMNTYLNPQQRSQIDPNNIIGSIGQLSGIPFDASRWSYNGTPGR